MRYTLASLLLVVFLAVCPMTMAQSVGRTNPNGGLFPDSTLLDLRFLQDAPAGKYGFMQVGKNGHFVWPNGKRARFWGVNISNKSVWVDKPTIDTVVDVMARSGVNMIRFEALDSLEGMLDKPGANSSREIDPAKLAVLDYWVAKARERGIYYYFDLLDFRQFKPGDEVPGYDQLGRAAKPYAFFDRRLIELQKEFAAELLTHRNPITGLRYVEDPGLAMVELCNEHGLFMRAQNLDLLIEPYQVGLRQQWNMWLAKKYASHDALKAAWGTINEVPVLANDEDTGVYSVRLPLFYPAPPITASPDDPTPTAVIDIRRASTRMRDGVQFLYEMQRAYFREMKAFLREIGLKVPVTGVVSNELLPDVASVAQELDFTSENYYADHPAFSGKEWQGFFFYNDTNPLRNSTTYQIAPWLSTLRWQNKPVVVREWATVWPNRYRAIAVPEMAAYASLQDWDAVLLFGYQITRKPETLSDFDHQADPTVWGLFGLGALAYLRGDIVPSPWQATLQFTPETLFRWPNEIRQFHRLSWFVRVNNAMVDKIPAAQPSKTDLAFSAAAPNPLPNALAQFVHMGAHTTPQALSLGVLTSATGEIVRRTNDGILTIATARTVAVCGELPVNKPISFGGWTLVTPTPVGAVMIVSIDGKPLSTSRRYLIKMVSRADNTGQALEQSPAGAPARLHVTAWGTAPILTYGTASPQPMRLARGKQDIVSLGLVNGTWELLVRDGQATLVCDTTGVRGTVMGRPFVTVANTPVVIDGNGSQRANAKVAR